MRRIQVNTLTFIGLMIALLILGLWSIYLYTHRGWTTLDIPIVALAADSHGKIWVVDTKGTVWTAKGSSLLHPSDGSVQIPLLAGDQVTALAIDSQGQIWAGTSKGSVILYNANKEWILYAPEISEEKYQVSLLAIDGSDRVWVKNNRAGLGMIDPNPGSTAYVFQYSPLTGHIISAFTIDDRGQVWVIENGKVIGKREVKVLDSDGEWISYSRIRAKDYSIDGYLAVDKIGQVWIGAYLKDEIGLLDSNGDLSTYAVDDQPVRYASPQHLVFDNKDRLWGTGTGLFMLDANGKLNLYHRMLSGFPDGRINALSVDAQGRIWILSYPHKLTVFEVEKSFPPKDSQTIRFISIAITLAIPSVVLCIAWIVTQVRKDAIKLATIRDFYVGLLGWFTAFTLITGCISRFSLLGGPGAGGLALLCLGIASVLSVLGLFLLYRKRRIIALGAFAAFTVNTIAILFMFSSLAFSPPAPYILSMVPFFMILN